MRVARSVRDRVERHGDPLAEVDKLAHPAERTAFAAAGPAAAREGAELAKAFLEDAIVLHGVNANQLTIHA